MNQNCSISFVIQNNTVGSWFRKSANEPLSSHTTLPNKPLAVSNDQKLAEPPKWIKRPGNFRVNKNSAQLSTKLDPKADLKGKKESVVTEKQEETFFDESGDTEDIAKKVAEMKV